MRSYPLICLLVPLMVAVWCLEGRLTPPAIRSVGQHDYVVYVEDYPVEREKTYRYTVEVLGCMDTVDWCLGREAYLYVRKDSVLPSAGDTLLIRTEWRDGGQLGQFDYGLYLRRQGLMGQGWADTRHWMCLREGRLPWYHPLRLRHELVERYRSLGIGGQELQTLSALTLGYKEELDRDLKQRFQRAGAAHVLAVSGLHTGVLYSILWALLTCFGYALPRLENKGHRLCLTLTMSFLMLFYACLTGLSASVVRSAVTFLLVLWGNYLRRPSVSMNTLFAAAIVILMIWPLQLWSVGFWMSFLAVASLLIIAPRTKNAALRLVLASAVAQLGTAPLSMYCFGQLSNYFLLTNLLVVPLAGVILSLGIATLVFGSVPYVGAVVVYCTEKAVWLMNSGVGWVESLPGSVTWVDISFAMMLALYGAIVFGVLGMKRSLWWLIGAGVCVCYWCYEYVVHNAIGVV